MSVFIKRRFLAKHRVSNLFRLLWHVDSSFNFFTFFRCDCDSGALPGKWIGERHCTSATLLTRANSKQIVVPSLVELWCYTHTHL